MKKKVALVTGGYTGELEISLKSAKNVYQKIDKEKYDTYIISLTKKGWIYRDNEKDETFKIDLNDFSLTLYGTKILFDVAFIVLHGSPGEDGKLQGYLEMLNIPYTSCDQLSSALTMNKSFTKKIVSDIENLYLAKELQLYKNKISFSNETELGLAFPLIVKTNNGGSSIGISKINNYNELDTALDKAFLECDEVLIEEMIVGREFSVGIYKDGSDIKVLPATEIVIEGDLFDFETKYFNNKLKELTPGRLSLSEIDLMENVVKKIYQRLNCFGIVRVDFFIEEHSGRFFFLEINTIPGQTDHSFVPKQISAASLDITAIYTAQLEAAIYRNAAKHSNVLV
ncbi:D-alanine--D-alanine ligase family protein [Pedobacter sp. UBA4863]|uniref:D-alanine--D-alanine ligase family protein n=1 Tax=Pedobacter sp. UBA4863 TaxID=1947060 RepID=UPI0025E0108F|nr:D-alanine--D-alanine ligase family protein [Pedobacter sp. UBA4863]